MSRDLPHAANDHSKFILDIHLNDQSRNNQTVFIIYEHLLSLMPGSVGYMHMPFNLHTIESSESYLWGIKKLAKMLATGGELEL